MQTHVVTRVIDGDTVEVSPEISRRIALQTPMERLIGAPLPAETPMERLSCPNMFNKIRLRNIDAPESGTPQGEKAIRYLRQFLEGKTGNIQTGKYLSRSRSRRCMAISRPRVCKCNDGLQWTCQMGAPSVLICFLYLST